MRLLLWPFSLIFELITWLRLMFYRVGLLKSYKLPVPVISVGNLTAGGSGKTPFVDFLISEFEIKNLKVGVLTRGYGRKSSQIIKVQLDHSADDVGDEPLWLKKKHPQAEIVVGADRVKSSKLFEKVDVVILDDGFQHFKIKRDLDIVLLDATSQASDLWLLPMGFAREKFVFINRADMVFLTKTNMASNQQIEYWTQRINSLGIDKVFKAESVYDSCFEITSKSILELKSKNVYLCSAIAKPHSFEWMIKNAGANVLGHQILKDHGRIDDRVQKQVLLEAKNLKADAILITEKDQMKWKELKDHTIPIGVLKIKTKLMEMPSFYDLVFHKTP